MARTDYEGGSVDDTERITAILRQAAAVVEDLSRGRRDESDWISPIAADLRPAAFAAAVDLLRQPVAVTTNILTRVDGQLANRPYGEVRPDPPVSFSGPPPHMVDPPIAGSVDLSDMPNEDELPAALLEAARWSRQP